MRFARSTGASYGGARRLTEAGLACLVLVGGCGDSAQNRSSDRENPDGAYAALPELPSRSPIDLLEPPPSEPVVPGGAPGDPVDAQAHAADQALQAAAVGGEPGARIAQLMDQKAEAMTSGLDPGARVDRIAEGIKVSLVMGILFDESSSELAPSAMDYLTRVAEHLIEFDGADVLVVAHSDRSGSPEVNLTLSEARARAALEYLVSAGVDRSRIGAMGRGGLEPLFVDDRDSEAAQRENRRVELAIYAGAAMKASANEGGVQ